MMPYTTNIRKPRYSTAFYRIVTEEFHAELKQWVFLILKVLLTQCQTSWE